MCVVLVLSVIRCCCNSFLDRILFYHDFHHGSCDYHWDFYGHSLLSELHFRLSVTKLFWFCTCATPWMFPPLDILLEYWIEHVTFGLFYVMFTFPARILYRGVPGFATDCPCGVWCRGLTTCPLYVGSFFGNLVKNDRRFVSLAQWKTTFLLFLIVSHLNALQYDNTLFVYLTFMFWWYTLYNDKVRIKTWYPILR